MRKAVDFFAHGIYRARLLGMSPSAEHEFAMISCIKNLVCPSSGKTPVIGMRAAHEGDFV
jgi:hypothetical protein